jgi:hypothetical protein
MINLKLLPAINRHRFNVNTDLSYLLRKMLGARHLLKFEDTPEEQSETLTYYRPPDHDLCWVLVETTGDIGNKEFKKWVNIHLQALSKRVARWRKEIQVAHKDALKVENDVKALFEKWQGLEAQVGNVINLDNYHERFQDIPVPEGVAGDWDTQKNALQPQLDRYFNKLIAMNPESFDDIEMFRTHMDLHTFEQVQHDPMAFGGLLRVPEATILFKANIQLKRPRPPEEFDTAKVYRLARGCRQRLEIKSKEDTFLSELHNQFNALHSRIKDILGAMLESNYFNRLQNAVHRFSVDASREDLRVQLRPDKLVSDFKPEVNAEFTRMLNVIVNCVKNLNIMADILNEHRQLGLPFWKEKGLAVKIFERALSDLEPSPDGGDLSIPNALQQVSAQQLLESLSCSGKGEKKEAAVQRHTISPIEDTGPSPKERRGASGVEVHRETALDELDSDLDYVFKEAFEKFKIYGLPQFRPMMTALRQLKGNPFSIEFFRSVIDVVRQKGQMLDHANVHGPEGLKMGGEIELRHALFPGRKTSLFTDYRTFLIALNAVMAKYESTYTAATATEGERRVVKIRSKGDFNGIVFEGNPPEMKDNQVGRDVVAVFEIHDGEPVLLTMYPNFVGGFFEQGSKASSGEATLAK